MDRIDRLDLGLRRALTSEAKRVEPAFYIDGIPYYDSLPERPTENPRITAVPMALVRGLVQAQIEESNKSKPGSEGIGWSQEDLSLVNPKYGRVEVYAIVDYDEEGNITNYRNDAVVWGDGPVDERTGLSTPGAVVVPIEEVDGRYYVHCFWQWRPVPWDSKKSVPENITNLDEVRQYVAVNRGKWFLTVPGGYAEFVGEGLENTAERETREEGGLEIGEVKIIPTCGNRASVSTEVGKGYAVFKRIEGKKLEESTEKIIGHMAVRIDVFRTDDDLVTVGIHHALQGLGLISESPVKSKIG